MGQYYYVTNIDKKEYINPHKFNDGLKLMEFGSSGMGTMNGLAILLADGNGGGSGDLRSNNEIIGSWSGDKIVIAGDYADENKWGVENEGKNIYSTAAESWKDISEEVIEALCDDVFFKKHFNEVN